MFSNILGHCPAITTITLAYPALIPVSTLYLFGKLVIEMADNIPDNEFNIRPCNYPLAGIARKNNFKKQVKELQNPASHRQIGGVDKIYA
jgi:hypothetical protein